MVALVVVLSLAAGAGMVLLWPDREAAATAAPTGVFEGVDLATGVVTDTGTEVCAGMPVDRLPDGSIPAGAECAWAMVELGADAGASAGSTVRVNVAPQVFRAGMPDGVTVKVARYDGAEAGQDVWVWVDFARDRPIAVIAIVFAVLVVAVARLRGLAALGGLVAAYLTIVMFMLPALRAGENPLLVALTGSVAIMVVVLYAAHGFTMKTTTALLGTVAGVTLSAGLGALATSATRLGAPADDEDYNLSVLTGIDDLSGLVLCGVVIASLGVLNDVTITQSSAVYELRRHLPAASRADLFGSGMRIGRDHLASTVYTIAFAYAGAALPTLLLIDIYGQPLGQVVTSAPIAEEIVRTAVGAIGLIATVPLTTAIAVAAVRPARRSGSPAAPTRAPVAAP